MRLLTAFCFLLSSASSQAQGDSSFIRLLESTQEITIQDSLEMHTTNWEVLRLDSTDVKKYFSPVLSSVTNNRLKNRSYYLTGKITGNPGFNIFLILEEKKKTDTTETRVLYIVTTKKEGKYISNLEAAVSGTKKRSNYDTYSLLYPDMIIRKNSKITVNEESLISKETYRIINSGRFVLSQDN